MAKKMTLEQLAQMTQKGFENTATKQGLESLREEMNGRFEDVDLRFDGVDRRLDSVEGGMKDIKTILGPLVRTVASMEFDIRELQTRVNKLEKKVGSAK